MFAAVVGWSVEVLQPFFMERVLALFAPWVVMFLYYWGKVWRFHVGIIWYGVFRECHGEEHLLLSTRDVSSLYVYANFGPAVKNWAFRFTVPKELVLVACHVLEEWIATFSRKKGMTCLSADRNDSKINLRFDLQFRSGFEWKPTTKVTLEATANVDDEAFPTNTNECRKLQTKKTWDFDAYLIPDVPTRTESE